MRGGGLVPSKGTYDGLNMSKRLPLIVIALSCRERAETRVHRSNRSRSEDIPLRTAIEKMRGWRVRSKRYSVVPYNSIATGRKSMLALSRADP